jgi:hypothetical protein
MKKIIVAAAALFASHIAAAGNWYIGLGLGAAHAEDSSKNSPAGTSTLAQNGIVNITSTDDRSSAVSMLAGYGFNSHIAAELGINDLGSYEIYGYAGPGNTLPSGREQDDVDAISLSAVVTAPLSQYFALYGKLGPAITNNEAWTCFSNVWWCDHTSDTKLGTLVGAGAWFTFPRLIGAFRLDINRFDNVGADYKEVTAGTFTTLQFQYVYTFE